MKKLFSIPSLLLLSSLVQADPGMYVCKTYCEYQWENGGQCSTSDVLRGRQIALVLNSLDCDTNKPFEVSAEKDLVCCVQKK